MSPPDWRESGVLIVGGGIAGLALAGALRRIGVRCELVERADAWAPVGAGIVLGVNAMRVMEGLGLADSLAARSKPLEEMVITDSRDRRLARTDLADLRPRFGPSLAMHRAVLHDVLLEAAQGIPIRMGSSVDAITLGDEAAEVRFSNGDAGRFGLVVGCDGLHSRVRELVFGRRALRYSGYTCWRMVVDWKDDALPTQEMWGVGKRFGMVPIGDRRVYCFAVIIAPPGQPDPREGRIERLRTRFAEFGGAVVPLLARLQAPEELIQNDLHEIIQRPWFLGKGMIVGDAAHGMMPDMGQGAAMALEDVAVLAELIATGEPLADVLESWFARREPRVRWVQNQSRRVGKIGQWENPLACRARNELARWLPDSFTQRILIRMAEQIV